MQRRFVYSLFCLVFSLVFSFRCEGSKQSNAVYYIAIDGNDNNDGSMKQPFRTLDKAVLEISKKDISETPKTIFIRRGVYQLNKSLLIKNISNLTITNYNDEDVYLNGGITLPNSRLKKTSKNATFSDNENIYEFDLRSFSVTDYGKLFQFGSLKDKKAAPMELFIDGTPQQLARWPNKSLLKIENVRVAEDTVNKKNAVFSFGGIENKNLERPDVWIAGLFSVGWAYDNLPVTVEGNLVKIRGGSSYGVFDQKSVKSSQIKASKNSRGFYFYNVPGELDEQGEWYMDRVNGKLYLWLQSDKIQKASLEISMLTQPLLVIRNSSSIRIKGITFTNGRDRGIQVVQSPKVSIQNCNVSNVGLYGITMFQSPNSTISNSKIFNTGAEGVILDSGDPKNLTTGNNSIENCEIYNFSRIYWNYSPGVVLRGVGNRVENCFIHDAPDQAITFSGNNHLIKNNRISEVCKLFSDIGAIYSYRNLLAAGTVIENNLFENISNTTSSMVAAIYFDEGSGGANIKRNIFFKIGNQGSSGFGAIHMNGGGNNIFENNIFIDCARAYTFNSWTDDKWIKTFYTKQGATLNVKATMKFDHEKYKSTYPWLSKIIDIDQVQPRQNRVINTVAFNVREFSNGSGFLIDKQYSDNKNVRLTELKNELNNISVKLKTWSGWNSANLSEIGLK